MKSVIEYLTERALSNKVVESTAIIHEIPPARKRQRGVRH